MKEAGRALFFLFLAPFEAVIVMTRYPIFWIGVLATLLTVGLTFLIGSALGITLMFWGLGIAFLANPLAGLLARISDIFHRYIAPEVHRMVVNGTLYCMYWLGGTIYALGWIMLAAKFLAHQNLL